MGDKLIRKGMVIGIIVLFIALTFVSTVASMQANSVDTIETISKDKYNNHSYPYFPYSLGHDISSCITYNDNLVVTVTTDKTKYLVGEPVVVTVWIKNTGDEDITIVFPSTQLTDFLVYKDEEIIYQWSAGKFFATILTPVMIPSGATVKLRADEWEQIDSGGNQVPVGNYEIRGWMVGALNHPEIHAEPVYIRIGPHNKICPISDGLYGFRGIFIYFVFAHCHYFCVL